VRYILSIIVLFLCTSTAFAQTGYFFVVEQNPNDSFASAAAIALFPALDAADTVTVIGMGNNAELLLPTLPVMTPNLLSITAGLLVPAASGAKYSPAISAALDIADSQAGALLLSQPGTVTRLVIITNTVVKGGGLSSPLNFSRVDYIALNMAADPGLAAIADGVWELAEQPDPDAGTPVLPFGEGFLSFLQTINKDFSAVKTGADAVGFSLGGSLHIVQKAVIDTSGRGTLVTQRGAGTGEAVYQFGQYAASMPENSGKYEVADAVVIFAAEWKVWALWFIRVIGVGILLVIGLSIWFRIKYFGPVFKVRIDTGDTDKPVSIARKRLGNVILGSGCSLKDVAVKIVSINKNSKIDTAGFDVLRENIISFSDGKWEIKKSSAFSAIPDMAEFIGEGEISKRISIREKIGSAEVPRSYTLKFYDYKGAKK
jgi:hypothetical protein